jgi:hypothetical protein
MDKPTRPIEMGIAFASGRWTTEVVDIPADTPEDKILEVAQATIRNIEMVGAWVYNSMDDDCPEVETEQTPRRLGCCVILSFDADQITMGQNCEQRDAAIEQVNLVLQREPHGLGARLQDPPAELASVFDVPKMFT